MRGRGPGRKADPVGVANTGSTALTPGRTTRDIHQLDSPLNLQNF